MKKLVNIFVIFLITTFISYIFAHLFSQMAPSSGFADVGFFLFMWIFSFAFIFIALVYISHRRTISSRNEPQKKHPIIVDVAGLSIGFLIGFFSAPFLFTGIDLDFNTALIVGPLYLIFISYLGLKFFRYQWDKLSNI
jgi:uncharacterized membrane protein YfcA